MKILIITQHIGKTAPGIVFEALIEDLQKKVNLEIWTLNDYSRILIDSPITEIKEPVIISKRITTYINNLFYCLFGISWIDWFIKIKIPKSRPNVDIILALCSCHNTASLSIAQTLSKKYNIPIAAYFVDAIPTPSWWDVSLTNKCTGRYIKRYTKGLLYLASSNNEMLKFQKNFIDSSCSNTDVLFTPPRYSKKISFKNQNTVPVFLFTGSCYGLRKPDILLDAFSRIIHKYPKSKLIFVGTNPSAIRVPREIRHLIEFVDYTSDLMPFYEKSCALIDIDACVDNDIFLSSKLTNYLFINRPIICQTGTNSPARNLFSNMNSILVCHHNSDDVYDAMIKCIESEFDYSERDAFIELFKVQNIADHLIKQLRNLVH